MSFASNEKAVKYNDKKKVKYSTTRKKRLELYAKTINLSLILTTERLFSCWINKIRNKSKQT